MLTAPVPAPQAPMSLREGWGLGKKARRPHASIRWSSSIHPHHQAGGAAQILWFPCSRDVPLGQRFAGDRPPPRSPHCHPHGETPARPAGGSGHGGHPGGHGGHGGHLSCVRCKARRRGTWRGGGVPSRVQLEMSKGSEIHSRKIPEGKEKNHLR